jgi:ribosomal protein S20
LTIIRHIVYLFTGKTTATLKIQRKEFMPYHISAKKAIKKSRLVNITNRAKRSILRSAVKKVLVSEKPEDALKSRSELFSLTDKSVRQHLIHWKKAARIKSRITRALNKKGLGEKKA